MTGQFPATEQVISVRRQINNWNVKTSLPNVYLGDTVIDEGAGHREGCLVGDYSLKSPGLSLVVHLPSTSSFGNDRIQLGLIYPNRTATRPDAYSRVRSGKGSITPQGALSIPDNVVEAVNVSHRAKQGSWSHFRHHIGAHPPDVALDEGTGSPPPGPAYYPAVPVSSK